MRKSTQSRNVTSASSKGVNSIATKAASIVCSAAMVVSMCPMVAQTAAYADDGEGAAEDPVVFTVNLKIGDNYTVTAKTYTQSEWNEVCAQADASAGYAMSKGDVLKVKAATSYVTLDDLIEDAGLSKYWTADSGASINVACYDGIYNKGPWAADEGGMSYASAHLDYEYFPDATATDYLTTNATEAPIILTACYGTGETTTTWADGRTAAIDSAYDGIAALVGQTEEDFTTNGAGAGNRFPNGVESITVNVPSAMEVAYSVNGSDPVTLKAYAAADWAEMAAQDEATNPVGMTAKGAAKVRVATEYVALDDLLADAGASEYWTSGNSVKAYCYDGEYGKGIWAGLGLSYDYAHQALKSFPNSTATEFSATGALDQPVVLASTYGTVVLSDYANVAAAGEAAEEAAYSDGNIGVVLGQTEESAAGTEGPSWQAGSSFATGVQKLVVNVTETSEVSAASVYNWGDEETFSCTTNVENAKYQWQWSKDGETWKDCSAASASAVDEATMTIVAKSYRAGYQYRCVVTDEQGYETASEPVTINKMQALITTSVVTVWGQTANFTIVTNIENPTYQWQYRTSSKGSWKNCTLKTAESVTDATLSVVAKSYRAKYQYRCIVTGADGQTTSVARGFDKQ